MQKPNGYDEASAGGFEPIDLGGHFCTIKQVTERQTSTGKNQIVVLLDFNKSDKQTDYFSKQFNSDDRPEKKWPFAGSKYITVEDYNDPNKTSRAFKSFCTCVEKSNNYTIQWGGKNWGAQFKGKDIGAVYGEEEHEYEGKVSMRRIIRWFCDTENADSARIPEPKLLDNPVSMNEPQAVSEVPAQFIDVEENANEEIPIPF